MHVEKSMQEPRWDLINIRVKDTSNLNPDFVKAALSAGKIEIPSDEDVSFKFSASKDKKTISEERVVGGISGGTIGAYNLNGVKIDGPALPKLKED